MNRLPDSRPTTSVRPSTSKRSFLPRPKSAIASGSRDNPWALTPPGLASNRASRVSGTPVESLQETEEAENTEPEALGALPPRRASTWFRHKLTLTPSSGQSSLTTDGLSTPSNYTNASNNPFLPTSAPNVNTRNRLVKRSTSQRFSNSSATDSTNRGTFRRPATSHQRNAENNARKVRHERSHSSATPLAPYGRSSVDSTRKSLGAWHWEPFFKRYVVRVKAQSEPSVKSPTDLFLGRKDELACIGAPRGQLPTLVMATSVTAQVSLDQDFVNAGSLKHTHFQNYQHVNDPRSVSVGGKLSQFREDFPERATTMGDSEPRVSSSFSLSSLLPSPSAAPFKIVRRRSSKRQEFETAPSGNTRHVSDSHALSQSRSPDATVSSQYPGPETSDGTVTEASRRLPFARSVSDVGMGSRNIALNNDNSSNGQIRNPKVRDGSHRDQRHSFSHGVDHLQAGGILSSAASNPRHSRGSRVASDHGSTLQGSDTDNSRVFSLNGDDYDAFSETNYDSFRTGGTNSSQSAQRPPLIENVFDDVHKVGFNGDDLSVLEEKLSDTSMSSSPRHVVDHEAGRVQRNSPQTHNRNGLEEDPSLGFFNSKCSSSSLSPPSPTPETNFRAAGQSLNSPDLDENLDELWDLPEEELDIPISSLNFGGNEQPSLQPRQLVFGPSTPDPQKKVNLWDWSEKPQDDEDRPKTVHGKNPADRSNRAGSRRPNVHIRSQSVPNVTDNAKARFNDAKKLDAWTLGGKGASEDWDEDFDVGDIEEEPEAAGPSSARHNRDSRSSVIVVPETILEKQSSVHGAFIHVRELMLMVEILRGLRRSADELGIRDGQASALWVEAEGIIDLATLEEDEALAPPVTARPTSPTSTDFDFDGEERLSTPASARQSIAIARDETPSRNSPAQNFQSSTESNDSPSLTARANMPGSGVTNNNSPMVTRPRQDSTVQVKTVLEHLQMQRGASSGKHGTNSTPQTPPAPSTPSRPSRPQKQPFDTQSLKDLAVRAGVVTRALQELVRGAEEQRQTGHPGTPQSHNRSASGLGIGSSDVTRDPLLSQLFQYPGPLSTPPSQRRSPLFKREREGTPSTPSGGLASNGPNNNQKGKHVTIWDEKGFEADEEHELSNNSVADAA